MMELNATHDPKLQSFVPGAQAAGGDFPIQNLPFGVVSRGGEHHCAVAIGDHVLDLHAAQEAGLVTEEALAAPVLNHLMARGPEAAGTLRARLSALLSATGEQREAVGAALLPMREAQPVLPVAVGAFTDFFTSLHHTERGGRLSGRNPPVPPNFRTLPIAYNSRATSVRVSGEKVARPNGQRRDANGAAVFGPSTSMDFELELGAYMGAGNALGQPVHIDRAAGWLWGYCLLNDWSARDIQGWESDPLGPFLSKSFSTTVSPWVVTAEALLPFRVPAAPRPEGDPAVLPYLDSPRNRDTGGLALLMEALIATPKSNQPSVIARTGFEHMYWTMAQMATHHMSNGCNLQIGDLLGSGTVSGPTDDSRACLAEITSRGTEPITLPGGEQRAWLLDGDEVVFRARAQRDGFVPIGFGECRGVLTPAPSWPEA